MKTLLKAAALLLACGPSAAVAQSQFGCTELQHNSELPAVEGEDGIFFRINADFRMNHPFSDQTVEYLAELSRFLKESGTTLIYVPIPTKSVTMPGHLPPEAALYGFDIEIATAIHDDILQRLESAGVATVDARAAMMNGTGTDVPFFKADFHWSAAGAALTAAAIGEKIKSFPEYEALDKSAFVTEPQGEKIAFSGMRRILQKHCLDTLPEAVTMTYETTQTEELDLGGGLDLFGDGETTLPIALLGTSFSDSEINNFPGFLAQYAELEVINYAMTGGNQFGAMTSYLTSQDFQETRPTFLVWENPIYNNLAQYGDQPLRELIAAASQSCTLELTGETTADSTSTSVDLRGYDFGPEDTLFVDLNRIGGSELHFTFKSADGQKRLKSILRGERLTPTGRFYMPLSGLWDDGPSAVEISMPTAFNNEPSIFACTTKKEDT